MTTAPADIETLQATVNAARIARDDAKGTRGYRAADRRWSLALGQLCTARREAERAAYLASRTARVSR